MNAHVAIRMDELPLPIEAGHPLMKARLGSLPLRDYQVTGVNALLSGVSYLALEMGLGKSLILIAYARALAARRILIVCPVSVMPVWVAELKKWWPDSPPVRMCRSGFFGNFPTPEAENYAGEDSFPGAKKRFPDEVVITSYDVMSREFSSSSIDVTRDAPAFDLVIADEGHYLKSRAAKRTRAVFDNVRKLAARMVVASGTPAPNHAGELYAPLLALAPERLRTKAGGTATQAQFENAFCTVVDKFIRGRHVRTIAGSKNSDRLRELLKGFMLRMRKRDVLTELPPFDMVTVPIEPSMRGLTVELLEAYADIISPEMTDDEVLRALQSRDENAARLRAALGMAKAAAAVGYLIDFLSGTHRKITIWAVHHSVVDFLKESLAAFNPVVIDGRTTLKAREAAVDAFLNDSKTRIFIGNVVAAGAGLTLIGPKCECSDTFFVETSYVPGDNAQAAARIHRLGQKDGVLARVFCATGTIDDRIQKIIARKSKDIAEIFDKESASAR